MDNDIRWPVFIFEPSDMYRALDLKALIKGIDSDDIDVLTILDSKGKRVSLKTHKDYNLVELDSLSLEPNIHDISKFKETLAIYLESDGQRVALEDLSIKELFSVALSCKSIPNI